MASHIKFQVESDGERGPSIERIQDATCALQEAQKSDPDARLINTHTDQPVSKSTQTEAIKRFGGRRCKRR